MKFLELFLVLTILLIFIILIKLTSKKENFEKKKNINTDDYKYIDNINKLAKEEDYKDVQPLFIEAQYHNDYRDVITSINNIAPAQKQVFNLSNIPVKTSSVSIDEVRDLIKEFIIELNEDIIRLPQFRTNNTGWDEPIPDKDVKHGWEKHMQSLGLKGYLYDKSANNSPIILKKIDSINKFETNFQIRYEITLIIYKKNTDDDLVIKISLVRDKRLPNNHNYKTNIIIEFIYVIGFFTKNAIDTNAKSPDNFYIFDNIDNQKISDRESIIKQLRNKLIQRNNNINNFNNSLDNEMKNFKLGLPHLSNYDSYKITQTIYDDLNNKRTFI